MLHFGHEKWKITDELPVLGGVNGDGGGDGFRGYIFGMYFIITLTQFLILRLKIAAIMVIITIVTIMKPSLPNANRRLSISIFNLSSPKSSSDILLSRDGS